MVHVFDKARGPGGRLASRRREQGTIDHGIAGFTAHDADFIAELTAAAEAGVATQWQPVFAQSDDQDETFAIPLTTGDAGQWLACRGRVL